jgi:uncharacterized glyoxalase superfamily protein PhnB
MDDKITGYRILIWSENPDELQKFYKDVLEFELAIKIDLPNDYGYAFKVGESLLLWIGKHSEVHGTNSEPYRHMFNLYVKDVFAWYEKLKDRKDLTIVSTPVRTPPSKDDNPKYVFTILDPEGNCLQMINL